MLFVWIWVDEDKVPVEISVVLATLELNVVASQRDLGERGALRKEFYNSINVQ